MHPALSGFHPVTVRWFEERFGTPTEPQVAGWPEIMARRDTLIAAPTGSGKTLAAFLACLDSLVQEGARSNGVLPDRTSIVYVSPLKALGNDIQKNLEEPLAGIRATAAKMWARLPEIRTAVRSGDTTASERAAMLRKPPHVLITTPESLYLLLTSEKGREMLGVVRTVIVDEIHAIARDKRGAHLALSLERLTRLVGKRPARIGLSATQKPIEEIARFLVGADRVKKDGRPDCSIVNEGHKRTMDLAIEVPKEEMSAVASKELWQDTYDRVAELVREHKSTLIFVNTRKLSERTTHALAERLGEENVGAHHGSLSKVTRLKAETRLKSGELKAVVATASLELGIDVGAIDLVIQLGSPRSFSVGLQRVGRAGHWRGAIPKGRLFPLTRDELVECAAWVRGVRAGNLEKTSIMEHPLDILAQQIVAEVATDELGIGEDDLFATFRRAWPYAKLPRGEFDAIVTMLSEGVSTTRGPRGAWLHRDGVNKRLRGRRGARLVAISSGGAIPDNFTYQVVKEPEGTVVGTLDEDFAVESMAGDIFLLGNTSWRVRRIEMGKVRVEDAQGAPPSIPFWLGEAPGRTMELSEEVGRLRGDLEPLLGEPQRAIAFLEEECSLPPAGALQAAVYLRAGLEALGALPTQTTLIAERFFDEGGGMQLVIHAPFGARMNRAYGLALRKRFCAGFNFELQAAATDDGILLSLGPQHSFPLDSVFEYLDADTVKEVLTQAVLDAPVFGVRWRWNASRALALLRQMGGKRVPPQIQRMRSDDLMAAAFPDLAACQEHVERPIKIPDHPLILETMRNCLHEAMDLGSLQALLRKITGKELRLLAKDTPTPSPLSHEILNSNPYTYLDDAPLEERRARAVSTRRTLSEDDLKQFGALDADAIRSVVEEAWPDVRDADELHDALLQLGVFPQGELPAGWRTYAEELSAAGRVVSLRALPLTPSRWEGGPDAAVPPLPEGGGRGEGARHQPTYLVAMERLSLAEAALGLPITLAADGGTPEREESLAHIARGWLTHTGPTTSTGLAARLGLSASDVETACLRLESQGSILRGRFTAGLDASVPHEWCERNLLARIHRRCLAKLRKEMQPVTTAEFIRYLLRWQHAQPGTQLHGARGVAEVIGQLQGMQIPAAAWEGEILPARVAGYKPEWLDEVCQNGLVMWGRLWPSRAEADEDGVIAARRQSPTRSTTLSLMMREDLPWLLAASADPSPKPPLGEAARVLLDLLAQRGAMFFNELQAMTGRMRTDLDQALWELVAAGEVTCDGFAGLRTLVDPQRRREKAKLLARYPSSRRPFGGSGGGRWSLLRPAVPPLPAGGGRGEDAPRQPAVPPLPTGGGRGEGAPRQPDFLEQIAEQYLRRWGIVFRDLLQRETGSPPWRELLQVYRRAESRGEVRGGRFVDGYAGEQYALPEAVEALRAARKDEKSSTIRVNLCAADPLNLTGLLLPGARVPATLNNRIAYVGGIPVEASTTTGSFPETLPLH